MLSLEEFSSYGSGPQPPPFPFNIDSNLPLPTQYTTSSHSVTIPMPPHGLEPLLKIPIARTCHICNQQETEISILNYQTRKRCHRWWQRWILKWPRLAGLGASAVVFLVLDISPGSWHSFFQVLRNLGIVAQTAGLK
jgi:hypothetical protein